MDRLWNYYREDVGMYSMVEAFHKGKRHHAYIISGTPGLGKRSVILGLAVELLYPTHAKEERAVLMERIMQGAEIDMITLWDDGTSLKIEDIRELQRKTAQTATGTLRIVCIERIERMSTEAANAFLKTLEEPGERTVFLLSTDHYEELLPTVVSRAQVITLQPFAEDRLREYIEMVAPGRWEEIHAFVFGRPGIALRLVNSEEELERYRRMYTAVRTMFGEGALEEKIPYIEQISAEKEDILLFLEISGYYLRTMMYEAVDRGVQVSPALLRKISYVTTARQEILQNVNKRLVLEHFLFLV